MERHANRLIEETSPYLLQHAHDPVDWYPWGPEALGRARAEGRPIFLSIGYSACHWCHVMARESFADERIAELLNRHFVSIKVDREERPDLDEVYMRAVQRLTGSGGWPLSAFLTPDLEPFHGGTYFPPWGGRGMPGFADLVARLAAAWEGDREGLTARAARLAAELEREAGAATRAALHPNVLDNALEALRASFDPVHGGFGDAPKFPHATDLRAGLRHHLRTGREADLFVAVRSLERMATGGVYDQLGGGFHRYSTDDEWFVPHFEKMLYDSALLVPAYLEAHLVTGEPSFARVAGECCEWMLREMGTPGGGFASAQDADSEGAEGRFFVWTPDELEAALGARLAARAQEWYGVTAEGTFEDGASVLTRRSPAAECAARLGADPAELEREMAGARGALLAARDRRVRPATDDKVLAGWNGLAVTALAHAFQVLGERRYLDAARAAASFVLEDMRDAGGGLVASARLGRARHAGQLDDHAFVIQGLVDLYESDFDERWLRAALELCEVLEERFADPERGGYFTAPAGGDRPLARFKSTHDGALPAGSGVHALTLLRLAELCGRGELAQRAERTIVSLGALVNRYPGGFGALLAAVDFLHAEPYEIVVAGERGDALAEELLSVVRRTFLPQRVVALAFTGADEGLVPLVEGRTAPGAYLCRSYACRAVVTEPEELRRNLVYGA